MIITLEQLSEFSGVADVTDSLQTIFIQSAQEIICAYLGFDVEEESSSNPFYDAESSTLTVPGLVKLVCLEIATLIELEENQNIGVNSSNFQDAGQRSYLNIVDYTKYLQRISHYRIITSV